MFEAFAVGALLPVGALCYAVKREREGVLWLAALLFVYWHMAAILAILWRLQ